MKETISNCIMSGALALLAAIAATLVLLAACKAATLASTIRRKRGSIALFAICILAAVATIHGGSKPPTPTPPPTPVTPETPETPVTPENPDTPENPENPETPDTPCFIARTLFSESAFATFPDDSAATVWDAVLWDTSATPRAVAGKLQIKVAKAKNGVATVTTTVSEPGAHNTTVRAKMSFADAALAATAADGRALALTFGADAVAGSFGDFAVEGMRNKTRSKNKDEKNAANTACTALAGIVNIATADGSLLSLNIGNRGKVRVSGTLANGAKVSGCSAPLILGEENLWTAVPVVWTKGATKLAFNVWMRRDGTDLAVEGLGTDAQIAAKTTPPATLTFALDGTPEVYGVTIDTSFLPLELGFGGGEDWTFPKGGKIKLVDGKIADLKNSENPGALKLTYKKNNGAFSGSFKVYGVVKNRLKTYTVSVTGLMVGDKGYGSATVKRFGNTVPVRIN